LFGAAKLRKGELLVVAAAFIPAVAELLFQSAKGLFFQFGAIFIGGVFVARLYDNRLSLLDSGGLQRLLLAVAVVVPLTGLSFMSRGLFGSGASGADLMSALAPYFASYAFGQLYAFSDWFGFLLGAPSVMNYATDPPGYGLYTFYSTFQHLGNTRYVPLGTFDEYFTYGNLITTNIYTMYRGLIVDFGLLGSLVATFVGGLIMHVAFYQMLLSQRPAISVAIFVFGVGAIYSSAIISLLAYDVTLASGTVLALVLVANARSWSPTPPNTLSHAGTGTAAD
jgi:oligosaccharide repeat unit polymerase